MAKERQPNHKECWLLTCMEKEHQAKRAAMLERLAEKDEEYRTKLRRQYGLVAPPAAVAAGPSRRR